uniref:Uncharacterized protein n=1 Tax=Onchocerca volvulus TaxID=6282 RepID=A0A8R1XWK2_ONCVO
MPNAFPVESLLDLHEPSSRYSMDHEGYLNSCVSGALFNLLKAHNNLVDDSKHPTSCNSKFNLKFNKSIINIISLSLSLPVTSIAKITCLAVPDHFILSTSTAMVSTLPYTIFTLPTNTFYTQPASLALI